MSFLDWIFLLVCVVLALVVSLDTEATVQLDVLTSFFVLIILMYYFLRRLYQHVPSYLPSVCHIYYILSIISLYVYSKYATAYEYYMSLQLQMENLILLLIYFVLISFAEHVLLVPTMNSNSLMMQYFTFRDNSYTTTFNWWQKVSSSVFISAMISVVTFNLNRLDIG